ncbi:MAG TPA: DUF501 domain-containing protein [Acidimicrobiales bacterium]|nr:DUF501 domain-containing protein [Acidimicrobiales bacterium]
MTDGLVATDEDLAAVTRLLGRTPAGRFRVVVRRRDGTPAVILNAPRLVDGTPMPTMLWLVDAELVREVARIESGGGVRRFERLVDAAALQAAHDDYATRRTALLDDDRAPAPSGGVGGTRQGVKCLHAHLANFLAGADDPVGRLVADEVDVDGLVPPAPSRDRLTE